MDDTLLLMLLTAAAFLAVILSLALGKAANHRITGTCAGTAIVAGIFFYSYGFSYHEGFSASVVIRTLLMVCRMFSGACDYGLLSDTPLFESGLIEFLFWTGHFAAFYMTASAVIRIIGKSVLRSVRMHTTRKGDIRLIYDASPDTVGLAGGRMKDRPAVLVTERSDDAAGALADPLGGTVFPGGAALCADGKFLKSIGVRGAKRNIDVYCIGDDPVRNLRYAQALLPALRERNVPPEAVSVFLLDVPEDRASRLLAAEGRCGCGTLAACSRHELIARLIVEKRPPWSFIRFDGEGRAENGFRVFIVGFGRMGQAVLRQMLINGQAEGAAFRAEVFDRRMSEERGVFDALYPALAESYDIVLHESAANTDLFFSRLDRDPPTMIVFCSGDHKHNMELGSVVYRKYGRRPDRPCLVQCATDSVLIDETEYRLECVNVREADRPAMALNHALLGGPSADEDWKKCDPFSRGDCRAFAAFCPALLRAAGTGESEALGGKWPPPPGVLENLARTEHLRRRAFCLSVGFRPMDTEEFRRRCEKYRRGEIESIENDAEEAADARLSDWEQLDGLSRLASDAMGKPVDYRAAARNRVMAIPAVLRAAGGSGETDGRG